MIAGVPPWANVDTNSTIEAPKGNGFTPPSKPKPTYDKPVVLLPDPESISEEEVAKREEDLAMFNQLGGISVEDAIDEAYEKYGRYLNENISKHCVRIGITTYLSWNDPKSDNLCVISPAASKIVNELLKDNGEDTLNISDPKQNIAILWLAASLYYDPDFVDQWAPEEESVRRADIGRAFALVKYPDDLDTYRYIFCSSYGNLFKLP